MTDRPRLAVAMYEDQWHLMLAILRNELLYIDLSNHVATNCVAARLLNVSTHSF